MVSKIYYPVESNNRWMYEKSDGLRVFWNGEKLISKQAKEISCPNWFYEGFPKSVKLEGELVLIGEGKRDGTSSILNSLENDGWKDINFILFDVVVPNKDFERRFEDLKQLTLPSHVSLAHIKTCRGNDYLMQQLQETISRGGEGIILYCLQ
jgi:DNA ligase-1